MKKSILPTVIIGIAAYNEEENIGYLIKDILRQSQRSFSLKRIVIASDGSSDQTNTIVKSFNDPIIKLIFSKERLGKSRRLDQIIEVTSSDILVLLDADIMIRDRSFVSKLILPLVQNRAEFSAAQIEPLEGETLVEKTLAHSMRVKSWMYKHIDQGDTVYTCYGPARAFAKSVYNQLSFSTIVADDAYSYLMSKKLSMRYAFVSDAQYFVRVPTLFADHYKQSTRFVSSKMQLTDIFGKEIIDTAYTISYWILFISLIYGFLRNPIFSIYYTFLYLQTRYGQIERSTIRWSIATSSKRLR